MSFGSGRFWLGNRRQARQFLFLMLPGVGAVLVLSVAPLLWPGSVFLPADKIVSGYLYGGALIVFPPILVCFYLWSASGYASVMHRRWHGPPKLLPSGRGFGLLTFLVLGCAIVAYVHGISAYWFATSSGITVQSGWFAAPKSHPWAVATERRISCYSTKYDRKNVSFRVKFGAGPEINIAGVPEFESHFAQLAALTASLPVVESSPNLRQYCPGFILRFLETNSATQR